MSQNGDPPAGWLRLIRRPSNECLLAPLRRLTVPSIFSGPHSASSLSLSGTEPSGVDCRHADPAGWLPTWRPAPAGAARLARSSLAALCVGATSDGVGHLLLAARRCARQVSSRVRLRWSCRAPSSRPRPPRAKPPAGPAHRRRGRAPATSGSGPRQGAARSLGRHLSPRLQPDPTRPDPTQPGPAGPSPSSWRPSN